MILDIIVSGDSHYDLKFDGIERTNDIDFAKQQTIKYAIQLKRQNRNVIYLDTGDVYHGTKPSPDVIARTIKTYNRLEEYKIPTFIIAGNHDVIDQKDKTSALAPLDAFGFAHIHIYHDITLVTLHDIEILMLPHISKARAVNEGFKTVQEYIDTRSADFLEDMGSTSYSIVLSHMNIADAQTGTEGFMIKGTQEDFPQCLKASDKIDVIFNGHIHKPQTIPNLNGAPIVITGDIQCNDFGERLDQKVFFHWEVETNG